MSITAYIGVIGSGKDYNADKGVAERGATRVDFKDDLLDMCSDIAGYNVRDDYEWFKEAIVGVRRPANKFQECYLLDDMKKLAAQNPLVMTGRRLLQRVGTEAIRKRDPDYWVKRFERRAFGVIAERGHVVVADCRFLNEVTSIRRLVKNHNFVFCDFRSKRYNPGFDHESERLAQILLSLGLKDGETITLEHFAKAQELLEQRVA